MIKAGQVELPRCLETAVLAKSAQPSTEVLYSKNK